MAAETIDPDDPTAEVDGVGPARQEDLEDAGYTHVRHLQHASVDELSGVVRPDVAQQIKEQVGDRSRPITSIAEGKDKAQKIPGAKAKTIKHSDGSQEVRVLEKVEDQRTAGGHLTVRKG